jgi:hypothetical protein
MTTDPHAPRAEDDHRHTPGPGARPLWNESFWFPIYDPRAEIGVVFRAGAYPRQGTANLYLFVTHRGSVVHAVVDHALPAAPPAPTRLELANGFRLVWEPPGRFDVAWAQGPHAIDLRWEAVSPPYLYPHPPDTTPEEIPRHIEGAGAVTGTVTINGTRHALDCLGHRDHSWGGERDWARMYNWDYLSGELGRDLWFHAVRVRLDPDMDYIHIGCLWDGARLHELTDIRLEPHTTDGGTRQLGVDLRCTDEQGRRHHVVGEEVLVNCVVPFGRTWLKDGITRYRMGDRVGYGIHELGYVERG